MKAAVFLAKGFEEIEAVSIIDILRRGGVDLTIVSVSGNEMVEGAHGIGVMTDALFYQLDYSPFDMLLLPGGMPGTENLANHEGLCNLIEEFYEKDRWLGAICAAPSVFGYLGILKGEKAVCYPGFEKYLEGAEILKDNIVVSNKIITGKGAGVAMDFSLKVLEQFNDKAFVEKLRSSMILN